MLHFHAQTAEEHLKWLCDDLVKIADSELCRKHFSLNRGYLKKAAYEFRERIGKALSILQLLYKNFDKLAAERGLDPELLKIAYHQNAVTKESKEYQELEKKFQELAKTSTVPCDKSEIDRIVRMIKE